MKVLIADDSATSRAMLRSALTRWGYDVVMAENGKKPGTSWRRTSAADGILDWVMPEYDGTGSVPERP